MLSFLINSKIGNRLEKTRSDDIFLTRYRTIRFYVEAQGVKKLHELLRHLLINGTSRTYD
jgi:hypothetical protein